MQEKSSAQAALSNIFAVRRHRRFSRLAKSGRRPLVRLLGEQLEPRWTLTSLPFPGDGNSWFQVVPTPPQFVDTAAAQPVHTERWLVALSSEAIRLAAGPAEANLLLHPPTVLSAEQPWREVSVVRGLGSPGQLLVEVRFAGAFHPEEYLRANPYVALASREQSLAGQQTPSDPNFGNQAHLLDIQAPAAWDVTTGNSDVVVAVVDSGIDATHPDLYRNIWINQGEIPRALASQLTSIDVDLDGRITFHDLNAPINAARSFDTNSNGYIDAEDLLVDPRWADGSDTDGNGLVDDLVGWDFANSDNRPFDDHGHGTHVAGIIGAEGNNQINNEFVGVAGVAWQVSLLPVKFLDETNVGESSNAIAAANYLTALRQRTAPSIDSLAGSVNVRVVNNSWGIGGNADPVLQAAIAAAGDAGILYVVGAGNGDLRGEGIDLDATPFFPASYDLDNIISVAAADGGQLARFSNLGKTSVDIAAPGVGILSTERGGNYGTRNGTSMATPQVSGVAALVFSQHPNAAVAEVKRAILSTANRSAPFTALLASGGRLNAAQALQAQTFAPQGTLTAAADITVASAALQDLQVRFTDTDAIDAFSFDSNDVVVSRVGFASTSFPAALVSVSPLTSGLSHDAIYRLSPPGGSWDALDSGIYEVRLRGGQVSDTSGLTSQERVLGTFRVQIDDPNVFIVNSTTDSVDSAPGDGQARDPDGRTSLRAAIMEANALAGAQTILLPEGTYLFAQAGAEEDLSATGDLDITANLTLVGTSALTTIVDARQLDRAMEIHANATASVSGISVVGGLASTGGGIRNSGTLTVNDSRLSSNSSQSAGGGIENRGTLTINRSWIDANETINSDDEGGGGIFNDAMLTLTATTVSGNRTNAGISGSAGGGGIHNTFFGTLNATNSTISGNDAAKGQGGGVFNAGVFVSANVTVTENHAAARGGGIFNQSGPPINFVRGIAAGPATNEAVLVNSRSEVIVASNNQARVFSPEGTQLKQFPIVRPSGIAINSLNQLIMAQPAAGQLQVFSSDGEPVGTITLPVGSLPTAVGVRRNDGSIFVADRNVIRILNPAGFQTGLIAPGPGQLGPFNAFAFAPSGFAFDQTGFALYVLDSGNRAVHFFQFNGFGYTYVRPITFPTGPVPFPSAIAFDPVASLIAVADTATDLVAVFDPGGNLRYVQGSNGTLEGQFVDPTSLAYDTSNRLYVADSGHDGVQVFQSRPQAHYVELKSSLIADNQAATDNDLAGAYAASTNNLVGELGFGASGIVNGESGNLAGTIGASMDPLLAPLQSDKGLVPVHAVLDGSPAVDAGPSGSAVVVDQLGRQRTVDGDRNGSSLPDVGAVERSESTISGLLFEDQNANGVRESTEPGLPGQKVFIDVDADGVHDPDEPSTFSQADDPRTPLDVETGRFNFATSPGRTIVVAAPPENYNSTAAKALPTRLPSFQKVAATDVPIDDLGGAEFDFLRGATIDGNPVVFAGALSSGAVLPDTGAPGTALFHRDDNSVLRPLVSLVPNSADPQDAGYPHSFDIGKVLFKVDDDDPFRARGLYIVDVAGGMHTVMDASTLQPNTSTKFPSLGTPDGISDGLALFHATLAAPAFFVGTSPGSLVQLTALGSGAISTAMIDGTSLVFHGVPLNGVPGIYGSAAGSSRKTVAGPSTKIPGQTGNFIFTTNPELYGLSVDAGRVAFAGYGASSQGVYGAILQADTPINTLHVIADQSTPIPGGTGNFTGFGQRPATAQDNGLVAFLGQGANSLSGIYIKHFSGRLSKLIDTTDMLDGKRIAAGHPDGPFELTRDAVSGNRIAFMVRFEDGSEAVYMATLAEAAVSDLTLSVAQDQRGVELGMTPLAGSLGGVVFLDDNGEGIRSSSEPGLGGWVVYLDLNQNGTAELDEPQQITDAQGGYRFDKVPGNQSHVVGLVVQAGFAATSPLESPGFRTLRVGPGQEVTSGSLGVKVSLAPGGIDNEGQISGTVYFDRNRDGARQASEPAIPYFNVYIDANNNGRHDAGEPKTETLEDGTYQFTGLANNIGYVVRAETPVRADVTSPRANVFTTGNLQGGVTPQDTVAADLNGDSAVDIVFVNAETDNVQVLLNGKTTAQPNGTGRFTELTAVGGLDFPIDIASGNFDGKPGDDLVIANGYKDRLSVFLASPGTATGLVARPSLTVGFNQAAVIAAPLFPGNFDDIAVLQALAGDGSQGRVVLFRNTGAGQFVQAGTLSVGAQASSLTASDLDGDGDQDLVVANTADKSLLVVRNDEGTFVKAGTIALPYKPLFVAAADVFGEDAKPELITAHFDDSKLLVISQTATAGVFTAAQITELATNPGPQFIAAVDIDADRDLDLLVADGSEKNVTLHRSRGGSGLFAAQEAVGIVAFGLSAARSLASEDFDGDGTPEIILARGDRNRVKVTGNFAGSLSLISNQVTGGANRAAIPTGREHVQGQDFGIIGASPAQNSSINEDVDNNGLVTANDALRIINHINAFGITPAPIPKPTDAVKTYLDVNPDFLVSASDALAVINVINSGGRPSAEGESQSLAAPLLPARLGDGLLELLSLDVATQKKKTPR